MDTIVDVDADVDAAAESEAEAEAEVKARAEVGAAADEEAALPLLLLAAAARIDRVDADRPKAFFFSISSYCPSACDTCPSRSHAFAAAPAPAPASALSSVPAPTPPFDIGCPSVVVFLQPSICRSSSDDAAPAAAEERDVFLGRLYAPSTRAFAAA